MMRKLLRVPAQNKPYKYKKIRAQNQIRLLSFRKTKQPDAISIKIEYADINKLPPYECLSYTWGDGSVRKTILCDGRELDVTENLYDALQRMKVKVDRERLFWADQISINQQDEEEKSFQVGMMFAIFSKPTRVICWLGEEDEYTARACELLREWAQAENDQEQKLRLGQLWSSDAGSKTEEQRHDEVALASFYSRGWFRRTWIVQEVCMPSQILMVCGSQEIPWEKLVRCFTTVTGTLRTADAVNALSMNVKYVLVMFRVFFSLGKRRLRLSELIKDIASREVSDLRDRYFALLGIMRQDGFTYPAADYSLTTKQVYMRYTRAMIDQDGTLCALSPGRLKFPNDDDDVPTWALNPEKIADSMMALLSEGNMLQIWSSSCTGATKPLIVRASSPSDEELQLYGLKMDRIEIFCDLEAFVSKISGAQIRWRDILEQAGYFARDCGLDPVYERTGEDLIAALMKTLVVDQFLVGCQQFSTIGKRSAEGLYNAFLRIDEKHRLLDDTANSSIGAEPGELPKCGFTLESLYEFARREFSFEKPRVENNELLAEAQSATTSAGVSNVVTWLDAFLSAELVNKCQVLVGQARLAVTANKSFALVPKAARVDDELCLLLGGFFPFVLRDAGTGGTHWLLGEAYVHGTLECQSGRECEQLYNAAMDREDYSGLTKFCLV